MFYIVFRKLSLSQTYRLTQGSFLPYILRINSQMRCISNYKLQYNKILIEMMKFSFKNTYEF